MSGEDGFPRLTNEVQHLYKVLLWDKDTISLPLKSGGRLSDYVPRGARSEFSGPLMRIDRAGMVPILSRVSFSNVVL